MIITDEELEIIKNLNKIQNEDAFMKYFTFTYLKELASKLLELRKINYIKSQPYNYFNPLSKYLNAVVSTPDGKIGRVIRVSHPSFEKPIDVMYSVNAAMNSLHIITSWAEKDLHVLKDTAGWMR